MSCAKAQESYERIMTYVNTPKVDAGYDIKKML